MKRNHELRIRCSRELRDELKVLAETVFDSTLSETTLSMLEYGLQNFRYEMSSGEKVLKVELVPSKNIRRLIFEQKVKGGSG